MAKARITITGERELMRKFGQLSEAVQAKKLEQALITGALVIQNAAKVKAPYISGNLRRSIHIGGHEDLAKDYKDIVDSSGVPVPRPELAKDTVAVYVGTDVNYAPAVEYGTRTRRPKPYLRPAADENKDAVKREVREALRDLVRAATR
jgi:HK97 gp10 family phage protein